MTPSKMLPLNTKTRLRARTSQSAYTLVEMVAVIVIVGILGSVASVVTVQAIEAYSTAMPVVEASYQTELAADRLRADLRSLPGTDAVTGWTADRFEFVDASGDSVLYALSGSNLLRNGQQLATSVGAFQLDYLDRNGAAITDIADLALVEIELSLKAGSSSYPYHATVTPRALTP